LTGKSSRSSSEIENINHVYEVWKFILEHPNAKLVKKRQKAIMYRLREGYSVLDLELAIEGCRNSDYHRRINDNGKRYDDIELICHDGVKLENFIHMRIDEEMHTYSCPPCKSKVSIRDLNCKNCRNKFNWKCLMTGENEIRLVNA
jgi:hypothetical protein